MVEMKFKQFKSSGGPVAQNGAVIGVISGGANPCDFGFPTLHTRIDRFERFH